MSTEEIPETEVSHLLPCALAHGIEKGKGFAVVVRNPKYFLCNIANCKIREVHFEFWLCSTSIHNIQ
jgi:hypothetical protein